MGKRELHEVNRYRDEAFPVELYYVSHAGMVPPGRGLGDHHWHEELQFTLITKGRATLQINGVRYPLAAGQGVLIGSGMIHGVTALSPEGAYVSLDFPHRLLGFFPGSRMEQRDVLPYVLGGKLPVLVLGQEIPWQKRALNLLRELVDLFLEQQVPGREYTASVLLVRVWAEILENLQPEDMPPGSVSLVRQERMQAMLDHLYGHYTEEITLNHIAAAANISVGECCRTFRECLRTTPYRFLKDYRIRKSTELLRAGHTVTETAGLCGFNQVSNYIAAFKGAMGCTPLQFVKREKDLD